MPEPESTDPFSQALRHSRRRGGGSARQKRAELLAAVAEDLIHGVVQFREHGAGHGDERVVARQMPIRVVIELEHVHIKHEQGQRAASVASGEAGVEMTAVAHAGEAVHQAETPESVLFPFQQAGTGGQIRNMLAQYRQYIEHVLQFAHAYGRRSFHGTAVADAPERTRGQGEGKQNMAVQHQNEDAENQEDERAREVKDKVGASGRQADVLHGLIGHLRFF